MRPARRNRRNGAAKDAAAERLIRALAAGCHCPADAFELCYWSREPGLLDIVRRIIAMPEETRAAIEAFVALAQDAKSIKAKLDARGVLTLASADAARFVALVCFAAANDGADEPQLIN